MSKVFKIISDTPSSDDFNRGFTNAGVLTKIVCGFCERKHFCDPAESMGDYSYDNEFNELRYLAEKFPNEYFLSKYNAISYGVLDGRTFIPECPCNAGWKYEQLILRHTEQIVEFLKNRAESLTDTAHIATEAATAANTAINKEQ